MYPNFSFVNEEFMARQQQWTASFPLEAGEWGGDSGPRVSAFHMGSMPEDLAGTADVVFFPRVLHNLARFESQGGYLGAALADGPVALGGQDCHDAAAGAHTGDVTDVDVGGNHGGDGAGHGGLHRALEATA